MQRSTSARSNIPSYGFMIHLDATGSRNTYVYDQSFNSKLLNANTVLRWEYHPGSSLFVVWTQGRFDYVTEGSFALRRDVRHLSPGSVAGVCRCGLLPPEAAPGVVAPPFVAGVCRPVPGI